MACSIFLQNQKIGDRPHLIIPIRSRDGIYVDGAAVGHPIMPGTNWQSRSYIRLWLFLDNYRISIGH